MSTQDGLWTGAGIALALAVLAGVADWRRARRTALDDAGWVPWRGIQVAGFFAAMALVAVAMRA
jgi:hypothetical protein